MVQGRLSRSQLVVGDGSVAWDLGLHDGLEGRACEPGQVSRDVRSRYHAGYSRGAARRANRRWGGLW